MASDLERYKGMRFPPSVDPATGRFRESEGMQSIKESVRLILMTQRGERFTRPDFGSNALELPFSDVSGTRGRMTERELRNALTGQEPRIADAQVRIRKEADSPRMIVEVDVVTRKGESDHVEIPL